MKITRYAMMLAAATIFRLPKARRGKGLRPRQGRGARAACAARGDRHYARQHGLDADLHLGRRRLRRPHPDQLLDRSLVQRRCETGALHGYERHLVKTYESLNNTLALSVEDGGLGVPSGEPTDVDFYISATIGTDFEKFYSAPATVRMTVTTAERNHPQVW